MSNRIYLGLACLLLVAASCAYPAARSHPAAPATATAANPATTAAGRTLFLKNCAHCHGADAHGDEGPDLYRLDWTDKQITARIRNGKKGQMTAFAGKLSDDEIGSVVAYLRTLK
ncbi:MAG TPA: cytochrome c [Dongiaceae bacterium]|jgi:mono/diheme cytochrome c family protein|nr:cytochrome c [Dongiaceae bacterium]